MINVAQFSLFYPVTFKCKKRLEGKKGCKRCNLGQAWKRKKINVKYEYLRKQ